MRPAQIIMPPAPRGFQFRCLVGGAYPFFFSCCPPPARGREKRRDDVAPGVRAPLPSDTQSISSRTPRAFFFRGRNSLKEQTSPQNIFCGGLPTTHALLFLRSEMLLRATLPLWFFSRRTRHFDKPSAASPTD